MNCSTPKGGLKVEKGKIRQTYLKLNSCWVKEMFELLVPRICTIIKTNKIFESFLHCLLKMPTVSDVCYLGTKQVKSEESQYVNQSKTTLLSK